jgi:hypothetical protein
MLEVWCTVWVEIFVYGGRIWKLWWDVIVISTTVGTINHLSYLYEMLEMPSVGLVVY